MTTERFALVTGASSGIGRAIARELAEHHFDLLICADEPGIADAATELGARGVDVQALQLDLRNREDVERLNESIIASGRPLDVAVLNPGVARGGAFLSTDLDDHLEVIDLNIRSTVHLAHRVVTYMVARNTGRLLLTSSIAAAMPGPFQSVYNASKSFLQSFGQALQSELEDTPVTVTLLMPGPTATNIFRRGHLQDTLLGRVPKDDPAAVARQAYDALMAGDKRIVAASFLTRAVDLTNKLLPDVVKARIGRGVSAPGAGHDKEKT